MKLTQTSIKNHIRAMIDSGTLDDGYLTDLFMYHPRCVEKMRGRTISHWRICDSNRGIEVVFTNGTGDTVSWNTMAKARCKGKQEVKAACHRQNVVSAFRREVKYQADEFRAWSGVSDSVNFHVGHDYVKGDRFVEILKKFVDETNIQPSRLKITRIGPGTHRLADHSIAKAWKAYHKKHAILRMEPAEENLKGNTGFKVEKWYY